MSRSTAASSQGTGSWMSAVAPEVRIRGTDPVERVALLH